MNRIRPGRIVYIPSGSCPPQAPPTCKEQGHQTFSALADPRVASKAGAGPAAVSMLTPLTTPAPVAPRPLQRPWSRGAATEKPAASAKSVGDSSTAKSPKPQAEIGRWGWRAGGGGMLEVYSRTCFFVQGLGLLLIFPTPEEVSDRATVVIGIDLHGAPSLVRRGSSDWSVGGAGGPTAHPGQSNNSAPLCQPETIIHLPC